MNTYDDNKPFNNTRTHQVLLDIYDNKNISRRAGITTALFKYMIDNFFIDDGIAVYNHIAPTQRSVQHNQQMCIELLERFNIPFTLVRNVRIQIEHITICFQSVDAHEYYRYFAGTQKHVMNIIDDHQKQIYYASDSWFSKGSSWIF